MHAHAHMAVFPLSPHHGPPHPYNPCSTKTLVKRFEKNQNAFHYRRVCEGVVIAPPTKESFSSQMPERGWIILQSHGLVFCKMEAGQDTPTPIHGSFFRSSKLFNSKLAPRPANTAPWLGYFSPSLGLLMILSTTQNQPQSAGPQSYGKAQGQHQNQA